MKKTKIKRNWLPLVFICSILLVIFSTLKLTLLKEFEGRFLNSHSIFYGKYINSKIESFSLLQTNGEKFTNKDLFGKYTYLIFGFTHCSGVCPANLALFKTMVSSKKISKKTSKKTKDAQFIFVSIDPRDDAEKVRNYLKGFNKKFIGLVSGKDTTLNVSKNFNAFTYINPISAKRDPAYQIEHAGFIYLINKKGRVSIIYLNSGVKAEQLLADYQKLIAEEKQ